MPTGKVRFYDATKGFGFLTKDGGGDVYVNASALPAGVNTLKPGQKVDFGIVEGRRGEQALSLQIIETPVSLSKASRKKPQEMAVDGFHPGPPIYATWAGRLAPIILDWAARHSPAGSPEPS